MIRWLSIFLLALLWWSPSGDCHSLKPSNAAAPVTGPTVTTADSLALVALYNSTNGPQWINHTNWLTGPVSTWFGIHINDGRVWLITLENNNLTGSLPASGFSDSLEQLTAVQWLLLGDNKIGGTLPDGIGFLTKLTNIDLGPNEFTGSLPAAFTSLARLNVLDLHGNNLSGLLPSTIGDLDALEFFEIAGNGFSGPLPSSFYDLSNLIYIDLSDFPINSAFPTQFLNFKKLNNLLLQNTGISGTIDIPADWSHLTILDVSDNQLESMPSHMGYLSSSLFYADFSNNNMEGAVPVELASMPSLYILKVNNNNLSDLPAFLAQPALVDVANNFFDFGDLLPNRGLPDLNYMPQKLLPGGGPRTIQFGDPFVLSFSVEGSANHYQWFKDNHPWAETLSPTLSFPAAEMFFVGEYYLQITNTLMPFLTLETERIQVTIPIVAQIKIAKYADGGVPNSHPTLYNVDFGPAGTGNSSRILFSINNFGNMQVYITQVAISGPNASDFITSARPVDFDEEYLFDIAFAPTSPGLKSAVISFTSNDPDDNPYEFSLSGTGTTVPFPTLAASNISFSDLLTTRGRISFTPGNGAKRIVVVRESFPVSWIPVNGLEYTSNSNFTLANDQGNGNKVVMVGAGNQVDITGLKPGTNYFVSVFEYNGSGAQAEYLTYGAPSASAKTLTIPYTLVVYPPNHAINQYVILNLTTRPMAGAKTYTIELNESPDFTGQAQVQSGSGSLRFYGLSYSKQYYTRVKTDLSPDWGEVTTFTTGAPEFFTFLTSPACNSTNVDINASLSASNVIGAGSYTIELNTASDFTGPSILKVGGISQDFSYLAVSTTYYARVKTSLSPNWGSTCMFTTGNMQSQTHVIEPANNSTNRLWALNVKANPIPGATAYTIQLSPVNDFASGVIDRTSSSNVIYFSGLNYNTKYYSRVKTDLISSWGPIRSFTTGYPVNSTYLAFPANGSTNVRWIVNLSLNPVVAATQYTIEANTDSNFGTSTAIVKSDNSISMRFTLAQGTTYFVRVKTDLSSVWGVTKSFTTGTALSLAFVTSPVNGGTGVPQNVVVYANALSGATSYTIELNSDPAFGSSTAITKTSYTYSIPFNGLSQSTTYYTRVQTNLAPGLWGTPSTSFGTVNPAARGQGDWKGDEPQQEIVLEPFTVIVYGNPFREKLRLLIETPDQQDASVSLFDLTGRTMHESTERTNTFIEIEKSMAQGVYLLRVQTRENTKAVRVIKLD